MLTGRTWCLVAIFLLAITTMAKAGDYIYTTNSDGTLTITGYTGTGGAVVIPSTIGGKTVTSIGDSAFFGCKNLTSVMIPDSVTIIGEGVFTGCSSLTSVTIPGSVTNIGGFAFYYCTSLTSIMIGNGVTSIGDSAFFGCNSLTSVMIPNSVTNIGNSAFYYCSSLTSVTIPGSVTSIGDFAFDACFSLMGVYFVGNAPRIGSYLFLSDGMATIYYLPGTTGWGWNFGDRPAIPWWDGPQVSANGVREDISINRTDTLKITVAMNADGHTGVPFDWWVIARANSSFCYLNSSGQWTQFDGNISRCHPMYQGGLFNLPATEVLNVHGLQPGSYTFWFVVHYPMTGILNFNEPILVDSVDVIVQ